MKKAIVAMSGGVDSSVAAHLIKEQGYETCGATLKLFCSDDLKFNNEKSCCSEQHIKDAKNVANKLNIPYTVYNYEENFEDKVIKKFINDYETGGTPNPCVDCNRFIKFEKLINKSKELNIDYLVTGHYGIIEYDEESNRYLLKKAVDKSKDQSYVLYSLNQDQLSRTLLPLGNMTKEEVRKTAEKIALINADKKDSQDICFIPDGDYAKFIETFANKQYPQGNFIDTKGNVLGKHQGIIRYTIGQRKGLGLSLPNPMYVCKKDVNNNTVTLGNNEELFSKTLTANNINLISIDKIDKPLNINAKIRYNQKEQPATVTQIDTDRILVEFKEPQRAIAKGQSVVLYDGDYVVGGGTIE